MFKLPEGFRGRGPFAVQLWWFVQLFLFRLSPQFMYGWRRFLLRCFGAKVGTGVLVRPSVTVTYPWNVELGDYCWIGDGATLYSLGAIEIGPNAVVSQFCYLCGGGHDYHSQSFDIFSKKIVIGECAWLATDVFVAPGVTVGTGAVVGARSSVFHDLPPLMVCFGTPAVPVKARLEGEGRPLRR